MEEDPKDHDFDQRQDGPFQRPSVQISDSLPHRNDPDDTPLEKVKSKSLPDAMDPPSSPMLPPPRHSTQMARSRDPIPFSQQGRRSTQISRKSGQARPSRDFDRRLDGPFGRPSITMTRRQSSGLTLPTSPEVGPHRRGTENAIEDEEGRADAKEPVEAAASDQVPTSIQTFQSNDAAFEPEPPPLHYTLQTRKLSIAIFWSLILIDSIAMPIALYFGLWYGTSLSPNTVFSIVTAALGGVSIIEYVLRFRRLWRKGSTCRVIGARRMYLDWFHWNFSLAWVVVMVELIVGTIPKNPPIRLLSMPVASMLYVISAELLLVDILRYFEVPAPIRMSSIPKGAQLRPGIYSVIEDVCAVDGSGGTEFRENFNKRYEASHVFRAMLRRLGEFWAIGGVAAATVTTILVFTLEKDAAYVVGWSVPFIWAGIWTVGTFWYAKRKLREEKKAWAEEVARKSNA